MSNRQSLSVPVDTNLGATNSTSVVPNPPAGEGQPSGATPLSGELVWVLEIEEATATPVAVQGTFNAELQISLDAASSWRAGDGTEVQLDDPSLATNQQVVRRVNIGRAFRDELAVVDPTLIRFRTVYSTTGRTTADAAATVAVTSYLTRGAAA